MKGFTVTLDYEANIEEVQKAINMLKGVKSVEPLEKVGTGKVGAITPAEAASLRKTTIHPGVIKAVNNIIAKNFDGYNSFTVLQKDILAEFKKLHPRYDTQKLFKNKDMDFENLFEDEGWSIYYDSPGYCETYEASFQFKPKKKK